MPGTGYHRLFFFANSHRSMSPGTGSLRACHYLRFVLHLFLPK